MVSAQLPSGSSAADSVQMVGDAPALQVATQAVASAISFAEAQLGKPYLSDGSVTSPGNVGLVVGNGKMIHVYSGALSTHLLTAWMEGVVAEFVGSGVARRGNRA